MGDQKPSIIEIEAYLNGILFGAELDEIYIFPDEIKVRLDNPYRDLDNIYKYYIVLAREHECIGAIGDLCELVKQRITSISFDENMVVTIAFFERELTSSVYTIEQARHYPAEKDRWNISRKRDKKLVISDNLGIYMNQGNSVSS